MQAMAGWEFWTVAGGLAVAVVAILAGAMRRVQTQAADSAASNLAVYRDQLAEIERDLARGTIDPDEASRLRAEIGKRVIEADRARTAAPAVGMSGSAYRLGLGLILGLGLPGTLAVYWGLGAPGYPDMELGPRLAELDAGMAGRPAQDAMLQTLGRARDAGLDQRLQAELQAASDPEALRSRYRVAFEAGRMQEAVRLQQRLLEVLGDAAGSNDQANLALALVAEANGYVSPEAETALRASLKADMGNELSRYLVGEMFLQGGRFDQAFRFWRPIAEGGMPGSPWVKSIRERIEEVADLAGIRYALPATAAGPTGPTAAAPAGPTAADMAAAGTMAPKDRQAMIEGMVAQLSDRLATDGGSVEEWNQLIRSLAVLQRLQEAQKIYDEAKVKFAGRPSELSFLRLAAVETGLIP